VRLLQDDGSFRDSRDSDLTPLVFLLPVRIWCLRPYPPRGGRERLAWVLHRRPHLVLVEFALNDAFVGVDLREFRDDLLAIAEACLRADAVPVLVTSPPPAARADLLVALPYYEAITARALPATEAGPGFLSRPGGICAPRRDFDR
jgi:hypothetical protein